MIELLQQQLNADMQPEEKLNRLRELLQLAVLKIIYDKGYFRNLAFVGGTALRILFNLRRFSEDLDFSLTDKKGYSFFKINSAMEDGLRLMGLDVQSKSKDNKTVQSTFLKFGSLLKKLGLSNLDEQKLSIKVEVDSNPPKGWHLETTLVNKVYLLNLTHFDLASLYATKVHACFFRKYIEGRNFYDLVWYIGKKIEPNYSLLNNAMAQTHGPAPKVNAQNFSSFLLATLTVAYRKTSFYR